MENQNNAAQPRLTDAEIRGAIADAHQSHGDPKTGYILAVGRAIESALLAKLRAEGVQAGDERFRSDVRELCAYAEGSMSVHIDTVHRVRAALASAPESFQARVQPWMMDCFGPEISADRQERNHRFLEEALELVQACGATASEAHQLVDYVFNRPIGEPAQEVGGVTVTLAALCLANGLDMHKAAETELARISEPAIRDKIRAKQAAKPKHAPLPEASAPVAEKDDAALRKMWELAGGSFHGPRVETGTMPEAQLLPFLRRLASARLPAIDHETEFHVWLSAEQEERFSKWVGVEHMSPWARSVARLALMLNSSNRGLVDYQAAQHFARELLHRLEYSFKVYPAPDLEPYAVRAANAVDGETRRRMGVALTTYLDEHVEDGACTFDHCDSGTIDELLNAVLAELPQPSDDEKLASALEVLKARDFGLAAHALNRAIGLARLVKP